MGAGIAACRNCRWWLRTNRRIPDAHTPTNPIPQLRPVLRLARPADLASPLLGRLACRQLSLEPQLAAELCAQLPAAAVETSGGGSECLGGDSCPLRRLLLGDAAFHLTSGCTLAAVLHLPPSALEWGAALPARFPHLAAAGLASTEAGQALVLGLDDLRGSWLRGLHCLELEAHTLVLRLPAWPANARPSGGSWCAPNPERTLQRLLAALKPLLAGTRVQRLRLAAAHVRLVVDGGSDGDGGGDTQQQQACSSGDLLGPAVSSLLPSPCTAALRGLAATFTRRSHHRVALIEIQVMRRAD